LKPSAIPSAEIEVADDPQHGSVWRLTGAWRAQTAVSAKRRLDQLQANNSNQALQIDLSGIEGMDTAGAWLIRQAIGERQEKGTQVDLVDPQGRFSDLINALPAEISEPEPESARPSLFTRFFTPIGRNVVEVWGDLVAAMFILGSAVRGAQLKLGRRSGVSPAAIVNQIDRMGVRAVPIIVLMSFLIGAIIAQQGAFQLRYFGAEVFVVDLVGILQLREIGVLVFPRLVALTIALPLLTVIANFAALAGAAVVAKAYSGITYDTFLSRLREAIDISTIVSGMIKAPFMALVIGIVASVEGLKVGGSAESLGLHVTASVVKSIFVVILMDGLFAMFYAAIDF